MVTRAIVESIDDAYHVRVRIPLFDRSTVSNIHRSTDELTSATICTLTQYDPNLQVGDVVFVAFEDLALSEPVVIGYLYRGEKTLTYADQVLGRLEVVTKVKLPYNTYIDGVSPDSLQCLSHCKVPIQTTLDILQAQIDTLKKEVEDLHELIELS